MRKNGSFFIAGVIFVASSSLACGGSDAAETPAPADAGTDSTPACAPVGNGTVVVNVVGLPAGVSAKVVLTGPATSAATSSTASRRRS